MGLSQGSIFHRRTPGRSNNCDHRNQKEDAAATDSVSPQVSPTRIFMQKRLRTKRRDSSDLVSAAIFFCSLATFVVILVVTVWAILSLALPTTRRSTNSEQGIPLRPQRNSTTKESRETFYHRVVHLDSSGRDFKLWPRIFSSASAKGRHWEEVEPIMSSSKWESLQDSHEYSRRQLDTFETKECQAMYPWQLQTFPACNPMHEIDMTRASILEDPPNYSSPIYLTSGYWRDVWVLRSTPFDGQVVLKTARYMHNVTARNFDRNRRDSLVMERLTASPWVLDVYGYCANAGLVEFASGGDISTAIWPESPDKDHNKDVLIVANMSHEEQLLIGVQAALALAELHNFDKEGQASVAHTDISPGQFVKVESGRYKLQDFNRARFIRWEKEKQKPCPYNVSSNPGKNRSPEEYAYHPQTEKVDLYSLGNLFYMLLQKEWPFRDHKVKKAQSLVKKGYRPSFYEDVWNSNNSHDQVLKQAMLMCHEQDPGKRSSARQVADYLKQRLHELLPGVLEGWGEGPPELG